MSAAVMVSTHRIKYLLKIFAFNKCLIVYYTIKVQASICFSHCVEEQAAEKTPGNNLVQHLSHQ